MFLVHEFTDVIHSAFFFGFGKKVKCRKLSSSRNEILEAAFNQLLKVLNVKSAIIHTCNSYLVTSANRWDKCVSRSIT